MRWPGIADRSVRVVEDHHLGREGSGGWAEDEVDLAAVGVLDEDPPVAAGEAVGEAVHRLAEREQRPVDPLDGVLLVGGFNAKSEIQVGERVSGPRASEPPTTSQATELSCSQNATRPFRRRR